jgi:HEAT repeat protein
VWVSKLRSCDLDTIREMAAGGKAALPVLVWAIENPHGGLGVPSAVFWVLERIGPDAEPVLPLLLEKFRGGRSSLLADDIADALVAIAPDSPEVLKALKAAQKGEYSWTREAGACALAAIGKHDRLTLKILHEALPYGYDHVLLDAMEALGKIGPDAARVIPKLEQLMRHENQRVRLTAFETLTKMGEKGADRVGRVFRYAKEDVQIRAAFWVGLRDEETKGAVKNMRKQLREAWDEEVRLAMAIGLGLLGPRADEAVGDLYEALKDKKETVRIVSALALLRMGEKGVRKLRFGLDSSRKEVVEAATRALAHLDDVDGLVIEDLMDALRRTRSAAPAAEALAKMGKRAVPALVEGLSSKSEQVRIWCCYALGKMSAGAKDAVPALEKLAGEDPSAAVRDAADRALHWIRTG